MTIEELYGKLLADDELKASLAEASKAGTIVEWIAGQGVEATEEELFSYMKAAVEKSGELSDEELEKVAGGGYGTAMKSVGLVIVLYNYYDPDYCE